MARSYLPNKVSEIVALWRNNLKKLPELLPMADPEECLNLFEDWQVALIIESKIAGQRITYPSAEHYLIYVEKSNVNLVDNFKCVQLDEKEAQVENGNWIMRKSKKMEKARKRESRRKS